MISYLDTSALAKYYHEEPGSVRMKQLINQEGELVTSVLTELELTSFVERLKRDRHIDSPAYRIVHHSIEKDTHSGKIGLVEIEAVILKNALRLIRQRRLKVQDSIQLATALAVHKRFDGSMDFVCSDHALLEAARLEGLKCIDPTA